MTDACRHDLSPDLTPDLTPDVSPVPTPDVSPDLATSVFCSDALALSGPASLSQGRWQDDARFTKCLRASWQQQYADYLGASTARRLVATLADSGALYQHHRPATVLASMQGRPVGVAAFRPLGEMPGGSGGELALVTLLEVLPAWRGQGIGAQLLHALGGSGARLLAHVSIHRPRVRALYRAAGFVALQRTTVDHHGHPLLFDVMISAADRPEPP